MISSHLVAFRAELAQRGLHGFLVPRADEHLGEYVSANAERLAWLSGFTGSAGLAVVLPDRACLFTDGRYLTQAAVQLDAGAWEVRHLTDEPPAPWLKGVLDGTDAAVGYDPMLLGAEALARFTDAGLRMVVVDSNPVDAVWADRPPPPLAPATIHELSLAGVAGADKRTQVAAVLKKAGQDAAVLTDPASIAWLLNIRGSDVPFTPFALGFAVLHADETVDLFMAPEKLPPALHAWLGNAVRPRPRDELRRALVALAGKTVRVDPTGAPAWFGQVLREGGATVAAAADPCLLPKATKNPVECRGAREAHGRDAVAVCRFLHWLDTVATPQTEHTVAETLLAFRRELADFRGESFPAISSAGPNGAVIHYRVGATTARTLQPNESFLIDSGGQFGAGTTDVTRTVWRGPGAPPAELVQRVTRVLQGHIAISTLVFPHGVGGVHIDAFARRALWDAGLDYDHGTGHGVGSYLSVHEGPVSLSRLARPVPIAAGMILSNEPGFYVPGQYGIRIENLMLVQDAPEQSVARPFLRFETLTLAPIDRRLLDPTLLSAAERGWIDAYHARVLHEVGPALPAQVAAWLEAACAPLSPS